MEGLDDYPVLKRATANQRKVDDTEIEMPSGGLNPTQIFRVGFNYRLDGSDLKEKSEQALEKMKADLEMTLVHGAPQPWVVELYDYQPGTMGGVRHWLGRDLEPDDEISLAVLRPLTLRLAVGEFDLFNDYTQTGEWLIEASLWVKDKELTPA